MASNVPSDNKYPDRNMSQRQRKNKNKKKKRAQTIPDAPSNSALVITSPTTEELFKELNISCTELQQKVSKFCLSLEDRILNGYPFSTTKGDFVFLPSAYSTLSDALSGCGKLLSEEFVEVVGKSDLNQILVDHYRYHSQIGTEERDNIRDVRERAHKATDLFADTLRRKCIRCGRQFVPRGILKKCLYHPQKLTKRDEFDKQYYKCCDLEKNSVGCTSLPSHLYHQITVGQNGPLSGYFRKTCHEVPGEGSPYYPILALDCEMVYTTLGFEVARVTLVEPSGLQVLDVHVKPKGKIRNFNTEYSGITPRHLTDAKDFDSAQQLVLAQLSVSTVLVGHSLEKDLQALRIIHPRVLDTALLYRETWSDQQNATDSLLLYKKQSLKTLVKTHLNRYIQTTFSTHQGHSPFEDAVAALDLVLNRVLTGNRNTKVARAPQIVSEAMKAE